MDRSREPIRRETKVNLGGDQGLRVQEMMIQIAETFLRYERIEISSVISNFMNTTGYERRNDVILERILKDFTFYVKGIELGIKWSMEETVDNGKD